MELSGAMEPLSEGVKKEDCLCIHSDKGGEKWIKNEETAWREERRGELGKVTLRGGEHIQQI